MPRHRQDLDAVCAHRQFHRQQQVAARVLAGGRGDAGDQIEHALRAKATSASPQAAITISGPFGRRAVAA